MYYVQILIARIVKWEFTVDITNMARSPVLPFPLSELQLRHSPLRCLLSPHNFDS